MKLAILIPAYNEEKTLARVIQTLPKKFPGITQKEIIVVNDGSRDHTRDIALKYKVTTVSHWLNRGLGNIILTTSRRSLNRSFRKKQMWWWVPVFSLKKVRCHGTAALVFLVLILSPIFYFGSGLLIHNQGSGRFLKKRSKKLKLNLTKWKFLQSFLMKSKPKIFEWLKFRSVRSILTILWPKVRKILMV